MLGICVPVRDTLHTGFAYCLVQLTSHLTKNNIDYKLYFENGSIISDQRYRLTTSAMSDKCTQILWLDSDMLFPVSIYERLNNHNKMAVAATYSTRTKPYRNTAFKSDKFDLLWNKVDAYLSNKNRYTSNLHVGSHEDHYLPIKVTTETAWH